MDVGWHAYKNITKNKWVFHSQIKPVYIMDLDL